MPEPGLRDRFLGCIAASRIGGAMAAPVNGLPWTEVERRYGTLETLLPRAPAPGEHELLPGTLDENGERQKLLLRAVVRKGGRITPQDVRDAWLACVNHESARSLLFSYDVDLLRLAEAGMPADEIGAFCDYSRVAGFAAACQPIGLINAGDPDAAVEDALRCGRLYQKADSGGIKWAAAVAAGIAAACRPGADVETVLSTVVAYAKGTSDGWFDLTKQIQRALDLVPQCHDFRELRAAFDPLYSRTGLPFGMSFCNEIVPKALAVIALTRGRVRETLVAAVNMGRDAASVAAIACGIAGALNGPSDLLPDLVVGVDEAIRRNPFTAVKRTLEQETADLWEAFQAKLASMRALIANAAPRDAGL